MDFKLPHCILLCLNHINNDNILLDSNNSLNHFTMKYPTPKSRGKEIQIWNLKTHNLEPILFQLALPESMFWNTIHLFNWSARSPNICHNKIIFYFFIIITIKYLRVLNYWLWKWNNYLQMGFYRISRFAWSSQSDIVVWWSIFSFYCFFLSIHSAKMFRILTMSILMK